MTSDQGGIAVAAGMRRTVTHVALAKCGRVLCAFSYFYLPFYGLKPLDVFWRFDPFAWISSSIYQIDEEIEVTDTPEPVFSRFETLAAYLRERVALDDSIQSLFADARSYYRSEIGIARQGVDYSLQDLERITGLRSFDFRLMHRVLAQQTGVGYRQLLFDWFKAFEMLMEVEDDMQSVATDRQRGTFNVVYLATRRERDRGVLFVEQLRQRLEEDVQGRQQGLSAEERALCGNTFGIYRDIVQRPVAAADWIE